MSRLRPWIPAILFAGVIWTLSTGGFGSANTSRFILPVLRWLLPFASPATLDMIHTGIRKSGHVGEYFIFSLLLFRAVRGTRRGWQWNWALAALAIAAAYACTDEFHQVFVPGRGPAVHDVLIDTAGAGLAQGIIWWLVIKRRRTTGASAAARSS